MNIKRIFLILLFPLMSCAFVSWTLYIQESNHLQMINIWKGKRKMLAAKLSHKLVVDKWNELAMESKLPVLGQVYEVEAIPNLLIGQDDFERILRWVTPSVREYRYKYEFEFAREHLSLVDEGDLLKMEARKVVFRPSFDQARCRWLIVCEPPPKKQ